MDRKLNILVTGANGQLGKSIQDVSPACKDNYIFTDITELDITDAEAVDSFVEKNKIDVIVNCAAYTNVDKAEDEPDRAELINAKAPAILGEAIKKREGLIFHISTDYVFGGDNFNTPIKECQTTCPTGVYGVTKLAGEKNLALTGARFIIIRTSWLYSSYGENFVKKIRKLLGSRDEIKVVFDQCGTPTYAADLAKGIVEIINQRKFTGNEGIYHFSNEGVCSWFDFANEILKLTSFPKRKKVLPCHSSEFPSKVKRPSYSVLDKTKFKESFQMEIPYWNDSLKYCIEQFQRYD